MEALWIAVPMVVVALMLAAFALGLVVYERKRQLADEGGES